MSNDCIFCRIASGEIPAQRVGESDVAIAIRDTDPQAPVHLLVIPRKHVASLDEATDAAMLGELLKLAADAAREAGISEDGYRTVINTRSDGGQTVDHLHVHILGGRHMAWPPG